MKKSIETALGRRRHLYSRFERKSFPFVYLLIAFPVIQFAVFWGYVNLSMVGLAFQDADGAFSFQAFADVFSGFSGKDRWGFNLIDMLWRSIQVFLIQNVLCFLINIVLSYILAKKIAGHKIFRTSFMLPGIVGAVVFSAIMKSIYNYDGGLVNICQALGIELPTAILRNGFLGVAPTAFNTIKWQIFIFNAAGSNIILAGAYTRIPDEVFEAARLDGVGFFREIFRIAIPCVWSTVSTLAIFNICALLTCDYGTYLYTNGSGNPEMSTFGFYLYFLQVRIAEHNQQIYYSYASAFGIIVTLMTIPLVLLSQWLLNRRESVEF